MPLYLLGSTNVLKCESCEQLLLVFRMPRRFGHRRHGGYRGRIGYHSNSNRRNLTRSYNPYSAGNYTYSRYGNGRHRPYPWMRDLEEMAASSRRRRESIAREREESEERRQRAVRNAKETWRSD